MLTEFLHSWELFQNAYLVGLLIGLLLSVVGVLVVAKDQIFVGAAVSQASALGIAVGIFLAGWFPNLYFVQSEIFLAVCGIAFAILGTMATASGQRKEGRESPESITGLVFLLSSSLALVSLSQSPHGLEEVHRLLTSTIIGASSFDVYCFVVIDILAAVLIWCNFDALRMFIMEPEVGAAHGLPLRRWRLATTALMGLSIGLSIRISGMVFVFGSMVLPCLIAKRFSKDVKGLFVIAPLSFLVFALPGYVFAYHYDCPPGQMVVLILSIAALTAMFIGNFSQRTSDWNFGL